MRNRFTKADLIRTCKRAIDDGFKTEVAYIAQHLGYISREEDEALYMGPTDVYLLFASLMLNVLENE